MKGGWNSPHTDLILPLSPHHLLFTEIGTDKPDQFTLSFEKTVEIQKILSKRALRWIYARKQMKEVVEYRARYVDLDAFRDEEEQLKKWHEEQSDGEDRG